MQIGNPSSASIAASVWAFTGARQLSSITANAVGIGGNPSIGAGLIHDVRPVAGKMRELTSFSCVSAQITPGTYDGTTFLSNIANNAVFCYGISWQALGFALKNVSAGALNSLFVGTEWS